jgi:hypothetical protein
VDEDGYGTYTVEALNQLCEGLKGKRCAITDLKCAALASPHHCPRGARVVLPGSR